MDFIKRNLGLLALLLIGVVIAVGLTMRIFREHKVVQGWRSKVREQQDHIKRISEQKLALTSENLEVARKNRAFAQKQYENLKIELWKRFSIPDETMAPIDCLKKLQRECLNMRKRLEEKNILVGQSCYYFSFDRHAQSSRLPGAEEVPLLLKQLRVVEEIVELVRNSSLLQLQSIRRLMGTAMQEKDMYNAMPLEVVVVGEFPTVQQFVNALQTKSRYYFMLRSLTLERVEKNAPGFPSLPAGGGAGPAGGGGEGGMMGPAGGGPGMGGAGEGGAGMMGMEGAGPAGPAGGMMRGPGAPGAVAPGAHPAAGPEGMMGPEAMMMGGQGAVPGAAVPGGAAGGIGARGAAAAGTSRKETREDRLVFRRTSAITATIRFDFIEFPRPEEAGD